MYKAPYSRGEIGFISSYILMNGHITYIIAERIHSDYVKATGTWRASGAIYQAARRYELGKYNHLL